MVASQASIQHPTEAPASALYEKAREEPMALNSKQRKKLRSMANTLSDTLSTVGKFNVNDSVVSQAENLLEAHELIKRKVLEASELTAREAADAIVEQTGAECVQVIGRKFVIYRRSNRDDVEHLQPRRLETAGRKSFSTRPPLDAATRPGAAFVRVVVRGGRPAGPLPVRSGRSRSSWRGQRDCKQHLAQQVVGLLAHEGRHLGVGLGEQRGGGVVAEPLPRAPCGRSARSRGGLLRRP